MTRPADRNQTHRRRWVRGGVTAVAVLLLSACTTGGPVVVASPQFGSRDVAPPRR